MLKPAFVKFQSTLSSILLCSSNTPNLTQYTCVTWKTCSSTTERNVALPRKNFSFIASSTKILRGYLKFQRGLHSKPWTETLLDPPLRSIAYITVHMLNTSFNFSGFGFIAMNKDFPTYAVLLENVQGHKHRTLETECTPSFEQLNIPRGSLVESLIPSDISAVKQVYKVQASHAVYSSDSQVQSDVLLFASPKQLFKLTTKQKELLLAVDSCLDRIEVLKKLHWVESLAKGSEVYVTLASIPVPVIGVIRYVGELSGLDGTRFGVELKVKELAGYNNQTFLKK